MLKKYYWVGILVILMACQTTDSERPTAWQGHWEASWQTSAESFAQTDQITDFTMNGFFTFEGDSLTVTAQGYPGCIFGPDTISHTQGWIVRNDSLLLINEDEQFGISYQVKAMSSNKIELQLLDDIFVTLSKE
jgi:hypothetical protein